jgi:hypothetical protein
MADPRQRSNSRDLVHASVMLRFGTALVISTDTDFDNINRAEAAGPVATGHLAA